jgi:hypothetical protein
VFGRGGLATTSTNRTVRSSASQIVRASAPPHIDVERDAVVRAASRFTKDGVWNGDAATRLAG